MTKTPIQKSVLYPEVGKTYDISHSRKGQFRVKVTAVHGEFFTGTIAEGVAGYMNDDDRGPGMEIDINITLCSRIVEVAP